MFLAIFSQMWNNNNAKSEEKTKELSSKYSTSTTKTTTSTITSPITSEILLSSSLSSLPKSSSSKSSLKTTKTLLISPITEQSLSSSSSPIISKTSTVTQSTITSIKKPPNISIKNFNEIMDNKNKKKILNLATTTNDKNNSTLLIASIDTNNDDIMNLNLNKIKNKNNDNHTYYNHQCQCKCQCNKKCNNNKNKTKIFYANTTINGSPSSLSSSSSSPSDQVKSSLITTAAVTTSNTKLKKNQNQNFLTIFNNNNNNNDNDCYQNNDLLDDDENLIIEKKLKSLSKSFTIIYILMAALFILLLTQGIWLYSMYVQNSELNIITATGTTTTTSSTSNYNNFNPKKLIKTTKTTDKLYESLSTTLSTKITEKEKKFKSESESESELNLKFRENLRNELLLDKNFLEKIVINIIKDNSDLIKFNLNNNNNFNNNNNNKNNNAQEYHQTDNNYFKYYNNIYNKIMESTKMPYDDDNDADDTDENDDDVNILNGDDKGTIVKNERKRSINDYNHNNNNNRKSRAFISTNNNPIHVIGGSHHNTHLNIYNDKDQRRRRDVSSKHNLQHGQVTEFFHPSYRKELEEQDIETKKQTGKGTAPNGDDWVYLTTFSRVPQQQVTDHCKKVKEYCAPGPIGPIGPPGPKGLPGLQGAPGHKGPRGDVGLPGPPGFDGREGPYGPRGPKGDQGLPGNSGLDGRDGVPGEPGLDGVPGRAGADGIPGKNGVPGINGTNGMPGINGLPGTQGPKGAMGPSGEPGPKGATGPRGKQGKPGSNGTNGIPGINAWKVKLNNSTETSDLLIPPSIADFYNSTRTVIVEEGKDLRISCSAIGTPEPNIEWRRNDNRTISFLFEEHASINGKFLNISNITRNHMGSYSCIADNGIPPVASATYIIEVHFSPMITVYRQTIFALEGNMASMECQVEAFPEAVRYWERVADGKILLPGEKYQIATHTDGFKITMKLTINNLYSDDFGRYFCVAKNELNSTIASFEVIKKNPNNVLPTMPVLKVFGRRPPEVFCPPAVVCEKCAEPSEFECKDEIRANYYIEQLGNTSYPGWTKPAHGCQLTAVGKPVYNKFTDEMYGAWLKDGFSDHINKKQEFIYVTKQNTNNRLYEYKDRNQFKLNTSNKPYQIREGFVGNAHVVYNRSFYFHQLGTDLVARFDLDQNKIVANKTMPHLGYRVNNTLYTTQNNFMDFNVDASGLWVIYSSDISNNTIVAKLNSTTLDIEYSWNITLDHHKFGEMFIICSVLYAIDSVTDTKTSISIGVNLISGKLLAVNLPFTTPFRLATTVGYNRNQMELYSWDRGNQLTYPIRLQDLPVNEPYFQSLFST